MYKIDTQAVKTELCIAYHLQKREDVAFLVSGMCTSWVAITRI